MPNLNEFIFCGFRFGEEEILDDPEIAYDPTSISAATSNTIKKCKKIAAYIHRSPKASAMLKKECEARGFKFYRIVQAVCTRWNSLYAMLKRIHECMDCINFVLVTLKSPLECLSEEDSSILTDLLTCLRPFAEATEELGGEKYVTMSLVCLNARILLDQLRTIEKEVTTAAGTMLIKGLIKRSEERLLPYETRTVSS